VFSNIHIRLKYKKDDTKCTQKQNKQKNVMYIKFLKRIHKLKQYDRNIISIRY